MRPSSSLGWFRLFGLCQRRSIFRRWLLAAKMASARRGSRMRSTGEAGVRGAHVLDAVSRSPKLAVKSEWRIGQHPIDPVHIFTFLYPGPEPNCLTRPVSEHDQPHIRSPLETAAPTSRLRRAGAQANETILPIGISVHGLPRFVHPDPPELIRSWEICESAERLSSGGLHHGSLNDDASGDIFPQRHQQLARQRHDNRLLHAATVAFDPFFEPQSQRRLRLMA
jgi:hypothetical protein